MADRQDGMNTAVTMQPTWRDATWSLAGNDQYGDCAFVSLANLLDLRAALAGQPFEVGEAEAELFYAREAGFVASRPETDRGAVLEDVIRYWCANGWPADPTCQPSGYREIEPTQIPAALKVYKGLPCWAMLPMRDGEPDFTDAALSLDGTAAHAMLIVDYSADLMLISWAAPVLVSWRWWYRFGRQAFGIDLAESPG